MNSLVELIDRSVTDAAPDVLVRAYEGIGECTYAAHMPGYLRARKRLETLHHRWHCRPGLVAILEEHRFTDELERQHREMYRQPCLICEVCQTRRKWWTHSAYTPFGEPRVPPRELRSIPMGLDDIGPPYSVSL